MNRADRAKQFLPFDALRGLQDELRLRENLYARVEKKELSDEYKEKISAKLNKLELGIIADIVSYNHGHYIRTQGKVANIDIIAKFLIINDEKIRFDNLYKINLYNDTGDNDV